MACPGGSTVIDTTYGTPFCANNGWCTWYPWDSSSSRVQHVYDVCKNNSTGAISHEYANTKNLDQCC